MADDLSLDDQIDEIMAAVASAHSDPIPGFDDIPWGATATDLEDIWGSPTPYLELDWVDGEVGDAIGFVREVSGFETDAMAVVHPDRGLVMLLLVYFEPKNIASEIPPKLSSILRYIVWASHLADQFAGVVDCTSEEDCSVLIGEFQMGSVWRDEDIGTVGVTLGHSTKADMADAPWRVVLSYTNTALMRSIRTASIRLA